MDDNEMHSVYLPIFLGDYRFPSDARTNNIDSHGSYHRFISLFCWSSYLKTQNTWKMSMNGKKISSTLLFTFMVLRDARSEDRPREQGLQMRYAYLFRLRGHHTKNICPSIIKSNAIQMEENRLILKQDLQIGILTVRSNMFFRCFSLQNDISITTIYHYTKENDWVQFSVSIRSKTIFWFGIKTELQCCLTSLHLCHNYCRWKNMRLCKYHIVLLKTSSLLLVHLMCWDLLPVFESIHIITALLSMFVRLNWY